ncbi:MAG TPA: type VI secretion system ATPase TssH [Pyrinomonadaceae bacterium]|jgi:type VI secretion system protein VasG|nr:type VI secretion system ATPase TssH [Pyrinomonadaceae bacterium]
MNLNLKSLVGQLNAACRSALEGAAGLCLARTNYDVEVEHLLLKLLETPDIDFARVLRYYEVDEARLAADLQRVLDRLKTGNSRTPALSLRLPRLFSEAWLIASVEYGAPKVRSGHLLLALLTADDLAPLAHDISKEFGRVSVESLRENLRDLTAGTSEDKGSPPAAGTPPAAGAAPAPAPGGKTPFLNQYTIDLTERARAGAIDQVLGRDFEIRQIVDILTRRRQNNPILTGEAGVGKTAVAEGFALRVAEGDVPEPLRNVSLRTLDLGLLQAGAGIKGEFENRLKSVIEEVKASAQPIILFIDEAHTLIGAGGGAGQSDAANLLKPALARGELRTIAATTWAEYKKYFEKDAALARRFQVVKVAEPDEESAITMMRGLTAALERHHQVRILDEAVEDAVRLSHRYVSGRQLPDKAVSVLDTAAARVRLGQSSTPPAVEDAERRLAVLDTEIKTLARESAAGSEHGERLDALRRAKDATAAALEELRMRWDRERDLVARLREVRAWLEEAAGADGRPEPDLRAQLAALTGELSEVQGEKPLVQPHVDSQTIAEVISGWTGIPVGRMLADEINTVLGLADRLGRRVVGQRHALDAIARRIRTARARLVDQRRPVGVFLLVGPSGVGKTETALALAEALYGGERNLVSINMSEYQEAHTVSSLKGSPPGYVGYGEGGVLTEAVRRRPYSVVLLDEVEKAHPDVLELFYQVFDKGLLEDAEGREIDFKNTVIILTSNVAADSIMRLCADPDTCPEGDALAEAVRPELLKVFKPALLGRMAVVPYYPIGDEVMREIIRLQLGRIGRRLADNHRAAFAYDDALVAEIAARCREVESGARNVDHILTRTLLPDLSGEILSRMNAGERVSRVSVGVGGDGQFVYDIA